MRKKITVLSLTIIFSTVASFDAITSSPGSPAGRSGSPASFGTCATSSCHRGPAITTETISISTDIPATGFEENTDYTITINANDGGRNLSRMGFQTSVESAAGAEGSLVAQGNDIKTVGSGNFVTHTSNGISVSGGAKSWSFVWNSGSAPDQTTIYTAVNFANGNGTTTGDAVGTAQLVLTKDLSVGISELEMVSFGVFPNPASNEISFTGLDGVAERLELYDLKGVLVKTIAKDQLAGQVSLDDIRDGVYIITDGQDYVDYLHVVK